MNLAELFPNGVNCTLYADDTFPEDPENIQFISPPPVLEGPDENGTTVYMLDGGVKAVLMHFASVEPYPKPNVSTSIIVSDDHENHYWLTDVLP